MFALLVSSYHLHPIVDHFTIGLLTLGVAAELLPPRGGPLRWKTVAFRINFERQAQEYIAGFDDVHRPTRPFGG